MTRGGLGVSDSRAWTVIGDTQIHPGGITMTHQGGARGLGQSSAHKIALDTKRNRNKDAASPRELVLVDKWFFHKFHRYADSL